MAKGKKTGGRNFVKGVVTNPKGRPPTPPELKAATRLSKTNFELLVNKHLWSTMAELQAAMESPDVPPIEKMFVSIIIKAISFGDQNRAEWFAQRLIGKVKDVVEVESKPVMRVLDHEGTARLELGHEPAKKDEGSE